MIYLNGEVILNDKFPNGESHLSTKQIDSLIKMNKGVMNITFKYEFDSDLITLMFIKRYLDECGEKSHLFITYMPYSRMDRTEGKKVFTLKYVAEFINSLNFEKVRVMQPHSDVTSALLNNCEVLSKSKDLLDCAIQHLTESQVEGEIYIYYPDASAYKHFNIKGYKSLIGLKQRDFETGEITGLSVVGDLPDKPGFNVIMVDDLCSRGTTFQKGAESLKKLGANVIKLVVAHCENSIFEGEIFKSKLIDRVYTTNSILTVPSKFLPENLWVYEILYTF